MIDTIKAKPLLKDEICRKIVEMIRETDLKAGERIYPEKKLAEIFGVNHLTIRAACSQLVDRDILYKIPSQGTFFKGFEKDSSPENHFNEHLVGIIGIYEEHFFNKMRIHMVDLLQNAGFFCRTTEIPFNAGSGIMIDKIREMLNAGVSYLIITQSELEKYPESIAFFNENSHRFHSVVRLFGYESYTGKPLAGINIALDQTDRFNKAVARFKASGLRRIAYLGPCVDDGYDAAPANRKLISRYTEAMINHGLAEFITVRSVMLGNNEEIQQTLLKLLSGPDRPEAVICCIDYLAVKVYEAARELEIEIPEKLSMIGMFDTPWSDHFQLATFAAPIDGLCCAVRDSLLKKRNSGTILFPVDILEKKTIIQEVK